MRRVDHQLKDPATGSTPLQNTIARTETLPEDTIQTLVSRTQLQSTDPFELNLTKNAHPHAHPSPIPVQDRLVPTTQNPNHLASTSPFPITTLFDVGCSKTITIWIDCANGMYLLTRVITRIVQRGEAMALEISGIGSFNNIEFVG
jgi:hypothetical protein